MSPRKKPATDPLKKAFKKPQKTTPSIQQTFPGLRASEEVTITIRVPAYVRKRLKELALAHDMTLKDLILDQFRYLFD